MTVCCLGHTIWAMIAGGSGCVGAAGPQDGRVFDHRHRMSRRRYSVAALGPAAIPRQRQWPAGPGTPWSRPHEQRTRCRRASFSTPGRRPRCRHLNKRHRHRKWRRRQAWNRRWAMLGYRGHAHPSDSPRPLNYPSGQGAHQSVVRGHDVSIASRDPRRRPSRGGLSSQGRRARSACCLRHGSPGCEPADGAGGDHLDVTGTVNSGRAAMATGVGGQILTAMGRSVLHVPSITPEAS
jgi:hypothetical protein